MRYAQTSDPLNRGCLNAYRKSTQEPKGTTDAREKRTSFGWGLNTSILKPITAPAGLLKGHTRIALVVIIIELLVGTTGSCSVIRHGKETGGIRTVDCLTNWTRSAAVTKLLNLVVISRGLVIIPAREFSMGRSVAAGVPSRAPSVAARRFGCGMYDQTSVSQRRRRPYHAAPAAPRAMRPAPAATSARDAPPPAAGSSAAGAGTGVRSRSVSSGSGVPAARAGTVAAGATSTGVGVGVGVGVGGGGVGVGVSSTGVGVGVRVGATVAGAAVTAGAAAVGGGRVGCGGPGVGLAGGGVLRGGGGVATAGAGALAGNPSCAGSRTTICALPRKAVISPLTRSRCPRRVSGAGLNFGRFCTQCNRHPPVDRCGRRSRVNPLHQAASYSCWPSCHTHPPTGEVRLVAGPVNLALLILA